MPYEVRKVGDKHCIYKVGGGDSLGCHDTPEDAQRQIEAIYANEKAMPVQVLSITKKSDSNLRLMVLRSSNAYQDRVHETIRTAALVDDVDSRWKSGEFVGTTPLMVWHEGDPIGDIVFADVIGPFLLEVAQERPDGPINLAAKDEPPLNTTIKAMWDALEQEKDLGASIKFAHILSDREDGEYEVIRKVETSVLPRLAAANYITDSEIVRRSE